MISQSRIYINTWTCKIWPKIKLKVNGTYEKESMLRILGASGISMNNEFEKNVRRLRASKFDGTSIADSLTVSKRWSLLICTMKKGNEIDNLEGPQAKEFKCRNESRLMNCNEETCFFFPGFCLRVHWESKLAEIFALLMKRSHYIVLHISSILGCL